MQFRSRSAPPRPGFPDAGHAMSGPPALAVALPLPIGGTPDMTESAFQVVRESAQSLRIAIVSPEAGPGARSTSVVVQL